MLIAAMPPPPATDGGFAVPAPRRSITGGSKASGAATAMDQHELLLKAALASLATDPGLHPLAPYFSSYIADGVRKSLADLPMVSRLLALTKALLLNPQVHMEHYLHQLMPAVMSCLLTQTLGAPIVLCTVVC